MWDGEGPSQSRAQGSCGSWDSFTPGQVEVIHAWGTEGFPVGASGDRSATGGLGRHCRGGQLSRETSGGSGLVGSVPADAGWGALSGFASGLGCALGAWPWWSLKLPQSSPIFLETKASGTQGEGLASPSARWAGGRVWRTPHLLNTSKGEERLSDDYALAGNFGLSIYEVDL